MNLDEYIGEVESWMDQVRDDELGVEDYDFLDKVVHKGRDGNNGLGQVGAYLAVYEEDGEVQVDHELVKALDERQAELQQGGRNRFSNIVYEGETEKRDGNTLLDRARNEENSFEGGHERLCTMIDEARDNIYNLSETSAPEPNFPKGQNQSTNKSSVTSKSIQGGDNKMGKIQDLVETAVEGYEDGMDAAEAAEHAVDQRDEYLNETEAMYSEVVSQVEDGLLEIKDEQRDLQYVVGRLEATMDTSKADDTMDSIRSMHDDLTN